ncbi:hypothetical protein ACIRVF_08000 [Kitasatospora sp. NPDC101157]|uniref:hypothetical protein n=1 Tax=Kitasatospora sp. NPDC101157 TaxID=3364098 RepID=UPI003825A10C
MTQPADLLADRIANAITAVNRQWDDILSHTAITALTAAVLAAVEPELDAARDQATAAARDRVAALAQVPGEDMIGCTRRQILAAAGGAR